MIMYLFVFLMNTYSLYLGALSAGDSHPDNIRTLPSSR